MSFSLSTVMSPEMSFSGFVSVFASSGFASLDPAGSCGCPAASVSVPLPDPAPAAPFSSGVSGTEGSPVPTFSPGPVSAPASVPAPAASPSWVFSGVSTAPSIPALAPVSAVVASTGSSVPVASTLVIWPKIMRNVSSTLIVRMNVFFI